MDRRDLKTRFLEKVSKPPETTCWLWMGTTKGSARPYGMIWAGGRHRPASQVAWEISNGRSFPSGMMACHTCDNPRCVNPQHIWPGTMSDNIRDAVKKGRANPKGNAYRTHCKHGHEFTPDNTIIRPSTGHRKCRACRDRMNRSRYATTRAEALRRE
jgi:hypothetical protein